MVSLVTFISFICFFVALSYFFYSGDLEKVKNWQMAIIYLFYAVFAIGAIITHPLIGIVTLFTLLAFICYIAKRTWFGKLPQWLNVLVVYLILGTLAIGTLLEIIEVFAGRLF